jgi:hypothetical protein
MSSGGGRIDSRQTDDDDDDGKIIVNDREEGEPCDASAGLQNVCGCWRVG